MKLKLNKDILKLILILLTAVLSVSLIFIALRTWERRYDAENTDVSEAEAYLPGVETTYEEEEAPRVYQNGKWYTKNKDLETVLLIGLDKFEDAAPSDGTTITNNMRSDFLLLLLLDHGKKTCQAVHVNRDTMAEIQKMGINGEVIGTEKAQLALAHTYGTGGTDSGNNTVKAVSDFLYGVPIDHFVSVTMDAVPAATDLAGGIPLTVMDDLTAEDPAMKEGAEIRLTGEQALRYVRARQGLEDPSNVRRMERQRQFMEAFRKTYAEAIEKDESILMDALVEVSPYMTTDCALDELDRIGTCAAEYEDKGILTIDGEAVKGEKYMEFYADEDALKNLVLDLFYVEAE